MNIRKTVTDSVYIYVYMTLHAILLFVPLQFQNGVASFTLDCLSWWKIGSCHHVLDMFNGGFTRLRKFAAFKKLHIFATFWNNKRTTKRWVESSVEMCLQAFWGGYMPVRTVASQSKINIFAELCFVSAGWCFLLLFMHFFHSIACFGSVFFRFKLIRLIR